MDDYFYDAISDDGDLCSESNFDDRSSDGEWTDDDDDGEDLNTVCFDEDYDDFAPVFGNQSSRYVVLTEPEIVQRASKEAAEWAEAFAVPTDWAVVLLAHYGWNSRRLDGDWFADMDRVLDAVGLLGGGDDGDATVPGGKEEDDDDDDEEETVVMMTCGICMEGGKFPAEMASAGCAHRYCHACWRGYVAAAVEDGGVLALRCPDTSCSRAVLRCMVERFFFAASDMDGRDAYERSLARDYVEARRPWMKPCTAAGCGCAVESSGAGDSDVRCRCGNEFCWRCGGAPHWPSSCASAARWRTRDADAASADWILLHTKPCPRCRRPAQRDDDEDDGVWCDSVACAPPCSHRFCWRCLGPRAARDRRGRGHKDCVERFAPDEDAEEHGRRRECARQALDGFLHYEDLWTANQAARLDAERELRRVRDDDATAPVMERTLLEDAWAQVAEGRRVLGNALAYGRSLQQPATTEDDDGALRRRRWELFEHHRSQMDDALERLQQLCVLDAARDINGHAEFRGELQMMTHATRSIVQNFAKAVEEASSIAGGVDR
ncbi:hypothetical protein EJB05_47697, partial [Eragrostis curvula]